KSDFRAQAAPVRLVLADGCPVAIRGERINDLALAGQPTLLQPRRPWRHRRLQVGHHTEAGKDVIGSYGRGNLPYHKVEYGTRYPVGCARCPGCRHGNHRTTDVKGT